MFLKRRPGVEYNQTIKRPKAKPAANAKPIGIESLVDDDEFELHLDEGMEDDLMALLGM